VVIISFSLTYKLLITIPPHPSPYLFDPFTYSTVLNNSTLLDFQVQAQTGYYAITQKPGYMPGMPPVGSGDGYSEITFNPAESSDWSDTITVNLNDQTTLSPSQISSLIQHQIQQEQLLHFSLMCQLETKPIRLSQIATLPLLI